MTDTTDGTEVSRRQVLRTGAIASGAAVVGGGALVGTAAGSPQNNFGYVVTGSSLEGETVTLSHSAGRAKVYCDAGGSESRIKTEVWELEGSTEELYLIPSGYETGDTLEVGSVFTSCTKNEAIKGEVAVTKQ